MKRLCELTLHIIKMKSSHTTEHFLLHQMCVDLGQLTTVSDILLRLKYYLAIMLYRVYLYDAMVSYKPLFVICWTKLNRRYEVSMTILNKICSVLGLSYGYIMEFILGTDDQEQLAKE